ncbi:hypothetical protein DFH09DRAFT_1447600 [Mycena vulgaris]|nr:hypothetical protein DFH09DRAFT_1447600 [Mycena vulgaris]
MTVCQDCSENFYGLEEGACNKCLQLDGKSPIDQASIRLQDPLCRSCCLKLAKADSVPRSIIDVPGAFEQIQGFQTSDFISEFWELAQGYKQTASDTRLGLPRTQNSNLQKTHPASHSGSVRGQLHAKTLEKAIPGIAKGMTRVEEMKDTKARGKRIKMIISLAVNNGKKLTTVSSIRIVHNAQEDLPIYDVIGTVVLLVQEAHAKEFPKAAKIVRQMITFHAVESAAKYYCLSQSNLSEGTVSDLLLYYYNERHITKIQFDAKSMELKFAVNHSSLIEEHLEKLISRRVTVDVHETQVSFTMPKNHQQVETILVASDWKAGLALKNNLSHTNKNADEIAEAIHKTGFIGQGSSKNVVYARVGNEEYALGQSQDLDLSASDNALMLRAELRNILLGDGSGQVQFYFRFNVGGAILGVLEPLEAGHISASLGLPFLDFIATRYLPCSPSEQGLQKFTGNADCGSPPKESESLTAAIHSFTHFTVIYTQASLVFCDLQGMCNRDGVMMLIDPQSHSSQPDSALRMYWDNGPQAITHFLDDHLQSCGQNYVCNGIEMKALEFEQGGGDGPTPETPPQGSFNLDDDNDESNKGFEHDYRRSRSVSISASPQRIRKKQRTDTSPAPPRHAPLRFGTSQLLITVEDFLRLNDVSRISHDFVTSERKQGAANIYDTPTIVHFMKKVLGCTRFGAEHGNPAHSTPTGDRDERGELAEQTGAEREVGEIDGSESLDSQRRSAQLCMRARSCRIARPDVQKYLSSGD